MKTLFKMFIVISIPSALTAAQLPSASADEPPGAIIQAHYTTQGGHHFHHGSRPGTAAPILAPRNGNHQMKQRTETPRQPVSPPPAPHTTPVSGPLETAAEAEVAALRKVARTAMAEAARVAAYDTAVQKIKGLEKGIEDLMGLQSTSMHDEINNYHVKLTFMHHKTETDHETGTQIVRLSSDFKELALTKAEIESLETYLYRKHYGIV